MSVTRRISSQRELFGANGPELSAVTDGEINFLWSFIQGSITVPQTGSTLLRGYGFCERHAWIHIGVEMSFRDQYLLGPTILYSELIEKSLRAIAPERIGLHSLMRRLAAVGPCLLCALEVKNASAGACPQARLDRGAMAAYSGILPANCSPYGAARSVLTARVRSAAGWRQSVAVNTCSQQ